MGTAALGTKTVLPGRLKQREPGRLSTGMQKGVPIRHAQSRREGIAPLKAYRNVLPKSRDRESAPPFRLPNLSISFPGSREKSARPLNNDRRTKAREINTRERRFPERAQCQSISALRLHAELKLERTCNGQPSCCGRSPVAGLGASEPR